MKKSQQANRVAELLAHSARQNEKCFRFTHTNIQTRGAHEHDRSSGNLTKLAENMVKVVSIIVERSPFYDNTANKQTERQFSSKACKLPDFMGFREFRPDLAGVFDMHPKCIETPGHRHERPSNENKLDFTAVVFSPENASCTSRAPANKQRETKLWTNVPFVFFFLFFSCC